MNNQTSSLEFSHFPVMMNEVLDISSPDSKKFFIDCTFGGGGYTKEILKYDGTKVIGIDRDIDSKLIGNQIQANYPDRFLFKNLKFSNLNNLKLKNENIKGIVFDLGYSTTQIKNPKKGKISKIVNDNYKCNAASSVLEKSSFWIDFGANFVDFKKLIHCDFSSIWYYFDVDFKSSTVAGTQLCCALDILILKFCIL